MTAEEQGVSLTRDFNYAVGGQPTGVKRVFENDEDAPIYNLAGQRLRTFQRGLNIRNGKKVLVK